MFVIGYQIIATIGIFSSTFIESLPAVEPVLCSRPRHVKTKIKHV